MMLRFALTATAAAMATSALAQAPAASSAKVTAPTWSRQPSAADLQDVIPREALRRGENGSAVVHCVVNANGLLSACKVVSETPAGVGYGGAALMLTPRFAMKPPTIDGRPVQGEVTIPIHFDISGATPNTLDDVWTQRVISWAPWTSAPSDAELQAAYPKGAGGVDAHATLRCGFTPEGGLRSCDVETEYPLGVGVARSAMTLTSKFHVRPAPGTPLGRDGRKVDLAIHFVAPGKTPAVRYISQPDWTRHFDPAKAISIYPDQAIKAGIAKGKVVLDCTIADDGGLTACAPVQEAPAGVGMAEAAARTAAYMGVNLWTRDGLPTVGGHIKFALSLVYAGAAAEPAAAKSAP